MQQKHNQFIHFFTNCLFFFSFSIVHAQPTANFTQQEVIYGRKDGMALTMVALTPEKANGKAVVSVVSGGWNSSYNTAINYFIPTAQPFLKAGYTVFLTIHASNPKYSIPEISSDLQKAVQYIRYSAASFKIDPNNIAITGTSSGGHLSLMTAVSNDIKNVFSFNEVGRVSSAVQAVIVFAPVTDFLNFGANESGIGKIQKQIEQMGVWGAFSYIKWNVQRKVYEPIDNFTERRTIDSLMSPTQIISKNQPPIYIVHGAADRTIPIQQSISFSNKYKQMGGACTLITKAGVDHDLKGLTDEDYTNCVTWLHSILKVK